MTIKGNKCKLQLEVEVLKGVMVICVIILLIFTFRKCQALF